MTILPTFSVIGGSKCNLFLAGDYFWPREPELFDSRRLPGSLFARQHPSLESGCNVRAVIAPNVGVPFSHSFSFISYRPGNVPLTRSILATITHQPPKILPSAAKLVKRWRQQQFLSLPHPRRLDKDPLPVLLPCAQASCTGEWNNMALREQPSQNNKDDGQIPMFLV